MYRTYQLTEKEKDKITRQRWDGDTYYYDVFATQEECNKEEERLRKIEEEWKREHENYLNTLEA